MNYKVRFPDMRSRAVMFSIALVALTATGLKAGSFVVSATTDIWLAGQSSGSTVTGYFGTDTAPDNSPVDVTAIGGEALTFSIAGYTAVSVDGVCFDSTADAGACYGDEFGDSQGAANGISLAYLPAGALVGVFVGAGGPSGPTPPALDFTSGAPGEIGTNFLTLSPELDQLFFIGDGLTGTGTGSVQEFVAPDGATDLYLAVSDSVGASGNNTGSITVDTNVVTPEPGSFGLLASALGGGFILMLRRRHN